jgi:phospholipid transport system substrate-binding protein
MKSVWTPLFVTIWITLSVHQSLYATTDDAATTLVQQTTNKMLTVLKQQRQQIEQDPVRIYQLVANIVIPHFDFETIAQTAVGRDWRTASTTQRTALIETFREALIRTYAQALLQYSDQQILYRPAQPGPTPDTTVVPTVVKEPGRPDIALDYRMMKRQGAWKVYDITIENISLMASYRSQFRAIINRSGIDGLITELKSKNAAPVL